jgi:hypothetical protein
MQSTFCSWYATGGEIPGLLQSLPGDARSGNAEDNGHMFEKFNGSVDLGRLNDRLPLFAERANSFGTGRMSMLPEAE